MAAFLALAVVAGGCSKARKDAISLVNKGVYALDRNEAEAARSYFNQAAEVDPTFATAQYHLGLTLYHDFKDFSHARERFLRALELDPHDQESRYQLGRLLFDMGAIAEAKQQFATLLESNPDDGRAAYFMGRMAEQEGDLKGANRYYRDAIEDDPKNPGAFLALGLLYQRVGADKEAIQVHREGVRLNEDDPDNREQLAALLMKQGRADESLELLMAVEQLAPERAEVLFSLASAFLAVENDDRASYYLRAYLAIADKKAGAGLPNADVARIILDNIRKKTMALELRKAIEAEEKAAAQ